VPDELIGETLLELRAHFGAVSTETQIIRGQWENAGQVFFDDLIRVFIDVPENPDVSDFFRKLKESLKVRFKQIDVWMVTYPIEVV
jgi:hypothetical protein